MELVLEKGFNDFEIKLVGTKPKITNRGQKGTKLTVLHSKILLVMLNNFNEEIDTETLIAKVWGETDFDFENKLKSIRVHMVEIRKFLSEANSNYVVICNKVFCKISYLEPIDELGGAKKTLLNLLVGIDSEEITNEDLELIHILSNAS